MSYWVNIHDPPVEGESQSCDICLQGKNKHLVGKFNKGDLAFIYETKASPGVVKITDEGGSRWLKLQEEGRGGIVALVRITSDFNSRQWTWRNIPFIGDFKTQKLNVKRGFVSRKEINQARSKSKKGLGDFNPRINGGLRKLTPEEFRIMAGLVGFEGEPVQASLGILKDKGFTFEDFLKERQQERQKEIEKESKGI